MRGRSVGRLARGLFSIALIAYPRAFRTRFGQEMREAFEDQVRAARVRGRLRGAGAAVGGLANTVASGIAERVGGARMVRRSPVERRARLDGLGSGLRQAVRRLSRAPGFAAVTVLSVAFGVGAFSSILSVVDGALLEAPPYRDPERLVWVWRDYRWMNFPRGWLGGPDIAWLRERTDAFDGVVGFRSGRFNLSAADGASPQVVRVLLATDEFFRMLGTAPQIGRGFAEGESDSTAAPVVVLGWELFQTRFGGEAAVVGRDVYLNGNAWRVIGVMPRGFRFVMHGSLVDPQPADLYAVLQADLGTLSPNSGSLAGLARIREGATEGTVQAALDGVARRLDEIFGNRGFALWSVPLRSDLVKPIQPALAALLGASLFLLLALGANLATLLYGRAAARARDVALRSALGAGRFESVLNLVGESLLVCMAGCTIGLVLAPFMLDTLLALAPPSLPRREAIDLDASVVLATLAVAALLGLLAAIGPALRISGREAWAALRVAGPRAGGAADATRARAVLVAVQVALSLVLLIGAALLWRSVGALLRVDPGYATRGVLTARVPLAGPAYADATAIRAFHERLLDRLGALAGVERAGATNAIPLRDGTNQTSVGFPGAPGNTGDADADAPLIDYFFVTPDYLDAMGISVLEGRGIDARDHADAPEVALIDETLARRFYPGASAVGHRLAIGDTVEIVGVVRHARFYDVYADDRGQVYLPAAHSPQNSMYYALRTSGDPLAVAAAAQATLRELDPSIPLANIATMESVVDESLGQHRLSLFLIGGFALGALILATLGIYGVVANSVVRRTHEFGVRLALGAERNGILGLVFGEGIRLVLAGLTLGIAGSLLTSRALTALLVGVKAADALTCIAVAALLGCIALLACLLPALRATRIPPVEALRAE